MIPVAVGLITALLTPLAAHCAAPLLNRLWKAPSLLITQDHLSAFTLYTARDPYRKEEYLRAVESERAITLSMNLTNNDERTLTVERMLLELTEYLPPAKVEPEPLLTNGEITARIVYRVNLGTSCQDYQCSLGEGSDGVVEQIPGKGCDPIDVRISPEKPGIYRFKLKIFYSVGTSQSHAETGELSFISLAAKA